MEKKMTSSASESTSELQSGATAPPPDDGASAANTAAPSATHSAVEDDKHYFEVLVTDVEVGEDSEAQRTREAEDVQRLAFRPVVEDLTKAFERTLDARLADQRSAVDKLLKGVDGRGTYAVHGAVDSRFKFRGAHEGRGVDGAVDADPWHTQEVGLPLDFFFPARSRVTSLEVERESIFGGAGSL
jgi:hypothetical protein